MLSGIFFANFKNLKLFRKVSLYPFSTGLFQLSRTLVFFYAARILEPKLYGFWSLVNVLLLYRGLTHLGLIPAMNREIPFYMGKEDFHMVDEIRNITFTYTLILTIFSSFLIYKLVTIYNNIDKLLIFCSLLLFISTQFYHYMQVYLKSSLNFNVMIFQQILYSILFPLLVIIFTVKYKLIGFIFSQSLVNTIICIIIIIKNKIKLSIKFNKEKFKTLIKIGFPIMSVALLYSFFTTTDKLMIGFYINTENLGYYSFAVLIGNAIFLLPRALGEQIYPKMVMLYGQNSDFEYILRQIIKYLITNISLILPIVLGIYFLFPLIIVKYFSAYLPAIRIIGVILIGYIFLIIANGFGIFMLSIRLQNLYLVVTIVSVILNFVLNIVFIVYKKEIICIAFASAVSYFVFAILLGTTIFYLYKKNKKKVNYVT
ncbi:oligosaccharide flippase family protein [Desulfothermus okinawensis JCM 13304]